jgi:hypothetical protein
VDLCYGSGAASGNPFVGASDAVLSTYRWFCRWYSQTGYIDASTPYLAKKQRVSERTMYRRLAELVARGCIKAEVTPGVERVIVPLVPPPPIPNKRKPGFRASASAASLSGVVSGVVSGVLPYVVSDAPTHDTTAASGEPVACDGAMDDVVVSLVGAGVSRKVAAALVQADPAEVEQQLQALEYRKPRDRAAVLVQSIRDKWPLPAAFVSALEQKRKAAQQLADAAARAALERKRQEQRQGVSVAFLGLSAEIRGKYIERACEALHKEQPNAYHLMQGKRGFDPWVQARAVAIYLGES